MIVLEIFDTVEQKAVYKCKKSNISEIHKCLCDFTEKNNLPSDAPALILKTMSSMEGKDCVIPRVARFIFKITETSENIKSTKIKDVVANIKRAKSMNSEWHGHIYNDGCWWADVERHPYGQIRFWVGFEDKRNGNSRASLVTLAYLNNNGDLRYCTDGIQLKPVVWRKIQSTAKALIKEGILEI